LAAAALGHGDTPWRSNYTKPGRRVKGAAASHAPQVLLPVHRAAAMLDSVQIG